MAELNYPIDTELKLKDAGAITSSAAATVGGSAAIIDLGDSDCAGEMVIDVTAIDVASTDEAYTIILEGSDSSDFSSGTPRIVPLAAAFMGAGGTIPGAGSTSTSTGRHVVAWKNRHFGSRSRYVRAYTVCAGTTPSINYVAYLTMTRP